MSPRKNLCINLNIEDQSLIGTRTDMGKRVLVLYTDEGVEVNLRFPPDQWAGFLEFLTDVGEVEADLAGVRQGEYEIAEGRSTTVDLDALDEEEEP